MVDKFTMAPFASLGRQRSKFSDQEIGAFTLTENTRSNSSSVISRVGPKG